MDERPTKRRGPFLWLSARTWRFWFAIVIGIPALYVASFGPLALAFRRIKPHPEWADMAFGYYTLPLYWALILIAKVNLDIALTLRGWFEAYLLLWGVAPY